MGNCSVIVVGCSGGHAEDSNHSSKRHFDASRFAYMKPDYQSTWEESLNSEDPSLKNVPICEKGLSFLLGINETLLPVLQLGRRGFGCWQGFISLYWCA